MTGKIFRSTLAASLTVLLASLLVITGCLYTYFAHGAGTAASDRTDTGCGGGGSGRRGLSGPRPGHGGAADLGGIGRHSAV